MVLVRVAGKGLGAQKPAFMSRRLESNLPKKTAGEGALAWNPAASQAICGLRGYTRTGKIHPASQAATSAAQSRGGWANPEGAGGELRTAHSPGKDRLRTHRIEVCKWQLRVTRATFLVLPSGNGSYVLRPHEGANKGRSQYLRHGQVEISYTYFC